MEQNATLDPDDLLFTGEEVCGCIERSSAASGRVSVGLALSVAGCCVLPFLGLSPVAFGASLLIGVLALGYFLKRFLDMLTGVRVIRQKLAPAPPRLAGPARPTAALYDRHGHVAAHAPKGRIVTRRL
jgi:hypothetical protein